MEGKSITEVYDDIFSKMDEMKDSLESLRSELLDIKKRKEGIENGMDGCYYGSE